LSVGKTAPQVTKYRTHCANAMEQFFILSPTGLTKCSNLRILNPYTPTHRALIDRGGLVVKANQPSGIKSPGIRFHHDSGGSIPFNVHRMSHDADRAYRAFCRTNGLEAHSAMMPLKLAEFFIELTTEVGDLVLDPFGGSLKTSAAALKLDRRSIVTERCLNHIRGGLSRLAPYDLARVA
jgi:DNA modification methylase